MNPICVPATNVEQPQQQQQQKDPRRTETHGSINSMNSNSINSVDSVPPYARRAPMKDRNRKQTEESSLYGDNSEYEARRITMNMSTMS